MELLTILNLLTNALILRFMLFVGTKSYFFDRIFAPLSYHVPNSPLATLTKNRLAGRNFVF